MCFKVNFPKFIISLIALGQKEQLPTKTIIDIEKQVLSMIKASFVLVIFCWSFDSVSLEVAYGINIVFNKYSFIWVNLCSFSNNNFGLSLMY